MDMINEFQMFPHLSVKNMLTSVAIWCIQIDLQSTQTCQVSDYEKEIQVMQSVTKEEYLASIRRFALSFFSHGIPAPIINMNACLAP